MTILSDGVAIIDSVTQALGMQVVVRHGTPSGDGGTGDPAWTYKNRSVILEYAQKRGMSASGIEVVTTHNVMFLNPSVVVNEGDQITYKGTTSVVKRVDSAVDTTGRLYTQAHLA